MRSIFVVTGAFVGRIESTTRLGFWAEDPTEHAFDPSRLISVDLSRTPNAAASREISWDAVEVDDGWTSGTGGLAGTTLGGRWPDVHLTGAVYVEKGLMDRLPAAARPSKLPKQVEGREYEIQSVVYWSGGKDVRAGRRYIGHHAEILEEHGKLARVAIYKAGTSRETGARPMTMWLDLTAIDQCDAGPNSMTTIGVGDAPKKGALFLPCGIVIDASDKRAEATGAAAMAGSPKQPPAQGEASGGGDRKHPWGCGGPDAIETPKLPAASGGAYAFDSPKLPPLNGGACAIDSPKLPPAAGGAYAIESPKLPPTAGGAYAFDSPKLPPATGESSWNPPWDMDR